MTEGTHPQQAPVQSAGDPDEINLLEYVYVLVSRRRWIVGAGLVGLLLGFIVASVKGPQYEGIVLIEPCEADAGRSPSLSSFGALGGLVGSQLGLGVTPGLDRIETILGTRKFNAETIARNGLLPDLFRLFRRKEYRRWFDEQSGTWRKGFVPPVMAKVGGFVAKDIVRCEAATNNKSMTIGLSTSDSVFSSQLLSAITGHLNVYIRDNIRNEAEANVHYLDSILQATTDPLLREKLQELIASELEKMMVVSKEAFRILDPIVVCKNSRHKRVYPVAFAFVLGMMALVWSVVAHAVARSARFPENREYLAAIRREMRRGGL